MPTPILVIGSSSFLAKEFILSFSHYFTIYTASRRPGSGLLIDLSNYSYLPELCFPQFPEFAIIFASEVSTSYCEKNPSASFQVNCRATCKLVSDLNAVGIKCIFPSSTAVFNHQALCNSEISLAEPSCVYGHQKLFVEKQILQNPFNAVVRFTKVFSLKSSLLHSWRTQLLQNCPIDAFDDLHVAPLHPEFVVDYFRQMILNPQTGVFHLSPSAHLTYFQMALRLSQVLNVSKDLVRPVSSFVKLSPDAYRPQKAFLDVKKLFSRSIPLELCLDIIFN